MTGCYTAEVWIAYMDGALPPEQERHLADCGRCAALAEKLAQVEVRLEGAAAKTRGAYAMQPGRVGEAFVRFRRRRGERRSIACCLDALTAFLSGMVGSAASRRVLRAAAGHAEINEAVWVDFITRLSVMSADLCGEGAGTIVSYIGKLAQPEFV